MNLQYLEKLEMYMLRCIIEVGSHYTWGYQQTTRERLNSATKPRKNSPLSQKVSLSGIQCSYIFLCLWLNEQLGWTIYINITSWPNNQFTPAWAKVQIKAPAKAISIWKSASSLMTTRAAGVGISHANQTPWLWWIKWTWSVVVSAVTNLGILFPISGSEA